MFFSSGGLIQKEITIKACDAFKKQKDLSSAV